MFIFEPHTDVVFGLAHTIARCGGRVTRIVHSLEQLDVAGLHADIAVLDFDDAPGGVLGGLAFFRGTAPSNVHLVVVSGEHEPGRLFRCQDAGACAVVSKSSTAGELVTAFRRILGGAMFYDPRIDAT